MKLWLFIRRYISDRWFLKRRMIPGLIFFLSSMVNAISQSRYHDDGGGCMAAAD
jgi:hypothetical protein